jgi:prepilin peptidase CpaA
MTRATLISHLPLLALLTLAATIDLRARRIPNWLTLMLAVTGLMQSLTPVANTPFIAAVGGLAVGFALTFALFAVGALGGGDVKLLAGCGAWLGPAMTFKLFCATAVVGMLIVLVQCAWKRRLPALFRNSALLAVNVLHVREVGLEHAASTGQSCRSVDKPLPYAVPVLIALLVLLSVRGVA